jgi:hypothetical protein
MDPVHPEPSPVSGADAAHQAPTPHVWPPARRAVEALFAGIARLQHGRAFHPRGRTFEAGIHQAADTPAVLPTGGGVALVRLSKAVGLPAGIPDVYGLAFRLPDVFGPDRHQDVLLSTAGERPGLRHVLMPATGVDRRRYSSLLPFRHQGRLILLGARYAGPPRVAPLHLSELEDAAEAGGLTFEVGVARARGPWRTVAVLTLHRRVPAGVSERLRFHPWNTSTELPLAGPMSNLRAPAYEASQRSATSE